MSTIATLVHDRADDDSAGLLFEDQAWTWRELVAECATRAAWWSSLVVDGPPHIGLLLENVPDFAMWLGAAAVTGATVVGINPTRRGDELAADIRYTKCQIVITEPSLVGLLDGLDLGAATDRVFSVDSESYQDQLAAHRGSPLPANHVDPATQFLLLFTSGTTGGRPKAVIRSHGRMHFVAANLAGAQSLTSDDVVYGSMPLFHSNALMTAWAPSLISGAALALRRTFSASQFLTDVRRFGATYFNYVGKPLAYILATPEAPDDTDNPLTRGFGNEGNETDLHAFERRFGCPLTDGYGQTETGASIGRVPGTPAGALGMGPPGTVVLDSESGAEKPRARFDDSGRLLNADAATGEIVNTGVSMFEGYWDNDEANAERLRNGWYWTGDLGYRDNNGYFYFAGRSTDWLRVDGENFAAAPVERVLMRHPDVILAAVYGVPDAEAGDRLMAALQLTPGSVFDPAAFAAFLTEQSDLGPKAAPTFVRVVEDFPMTQTNKVLKRLLVTDRWQTSDLQWWRSARDPEYRAFTPDDQASWEARIIASGRAALLT